MSIREYVRANRARLQAMPTQAAQAKAVMAAMGCSDRRAQQVLSQEFKTEITKPAAIVGKPVSRSLSRAELLRKEDGPTRTRLALRKGVADLTDDDAILPHSRFCGSCNGIVLALARRVADEEEFQQYQFRVGDQVYWTTAATKLWALENVSRARDL